MSILSALLSRLGLAPDKIQHFEGGLIVSLAGAVVGAVAGWYAAQLLRMPSALLTPLMAAFGAVLSAGTAGVTKEGADWLDNRANPGQHEVSVWDAVATAAGCIPTLCLIAGLMRLLSGGL
ncbi:hypothetical protein RQP53_03490 [Paucibacter sp. APW11]|uniref:DUF4126 domain-containing protein n=1 Tax=Roseateles aquae TaxID=3077235 RepID=A0ABU3P9C7_9BURK|nr:hypothetical protein [Paucibacter sp. APW11]MDT8998336.1 hypothetical protein [Paucibacter sp. APW11]